MPTLATLAIEISAPPDLGGFRLGEWQPDIRASGRGFGTDVHFYVIPAQIAGRAHIRRTWHAVRSIP